MGYTPAPFAIRPFADMPELVEIFPWNDNFRTGIEEIDIQHKRLVELLNILVSHLAYQADVPTLNTIFAELKEYTVVHFETEERIWRQYFNGDAWEIWHKDSHTNFVDRIIELKAEEATKSLDEVIEDIVGFLTHWLALHILESDRRMAKVVLALPSGISLEAAKQVADREMSGSTRVLINTIMAMYDKLANRTVQLTREINRRKKAEEELRQRDWQLQKAKEAAERANVAKSQFLASMSHEIRTPFNAIIGMAQLMRRSGVSEEQEQRLGKIDSACQHLLSVINSILDLSKIEAGKLCLDEQVLSVPQLVQNVLTMLTDRARDKHLTLRVDVPPLAIALLGDGTRLQQALINYATNAIKFTEHGSVTLRVQVEDETPEQLLLRFEVVDTGVGIHPDVVQRLFSPFVQADARVAHQHGGTGLGLAITKGLAELMGGHAGVISNPGRGSSFWFTAWLRKAPQVPELGTAGGNAQDAEQCLCQEYPGLRVLVVEDDLLNQEVAREYLADIQAQCDVAGDGRIAVERVSAQRYDVILMDMQMPHMDGLEATRRIRELEHGRQVPIIAMTANAFSENRQQCLDAGMDDFLSKPVVPEDLFVVLLKWVQAGPEAVRHTSSKM